MSDREKIQICISKGYTIAVKRISDSRPITAIGFAMLDNGITLEPRFDIILCKCLNDEKFEYTDGFNIEELEIA